MAERDDKAVSQLNELIETCRDGERGFREAADGARNPQIKQLFNGYADQRRSFASELSSEVRRLGGEPEQGGSVAGALHHGWMNVKEAITGKDDKQIVAEAERGEDVAVRSYQEALNADLPPPVRSTVQRQFVEVRQVHDRVRDLERSLDRE